MCGVGTVPSGALSLNRGAGAVVCGGVWRTGAGARAVTLLGGARVGYLRAAVVAAPVSPAELTAARRVLTEAADRGYRAAAAALAEERER